MPTTLEAALQTCRQETASIRARRRALKRGKPKVFLYKNNPNGDPGLVFRGRLNFREMTRCQFPDTKNVSSAAVNEWRASHYLAKWILTVPNNPYECKNIVIRVDMYGGAWRWTGVLHHWEVDTRDGVDYVMCTWNSDMQFVQFLLCPPNPLMPVPFFQFPRDFFLGPVPAVWGMAVAMHMNILRAEGHPFTLPDDPGDLDQYLEPILTQTWQMHVKIPAFGDDSSLWTFIGARMNSLDSMFADALDDGRITLTGRRIFTAEGETVTGLLNNDIANGALVFEFHQRDGFERDTGTFFGGDALRGLLRSVVQYTAGGVEDTLAMYQDDETLWADQYWQSGFLGTLAGSPPYVVRDSRQHDIQAKLSHASATAVSVVVGGDNPTVDAIAQLMISGTGNLIGYFLLGGFDSLGDIASDIIMPFLVGTILAWNEHKNTDRATKLGWVHLHEVYVAGAEMNNWSWAAMAVWRGGFRATDAETSCTSVIGNDSWFIPGLHGQVGDRLGNTSGAYRRATGDPRIFVNPIEEMTLIGGEDGSFEFAVKVGQNKAAMTVGERNARLFKNVMDRISDIGVHLVQ